VYALLAARAVGHQFGISAEEFAGGVREVSARLRKRVLTGPRGSVVIDDTYNASPPSVPAALDLLSQECGRRIAVLGDMLELGAAEESGHRQVGARAGEVADLLYVYGNRMSRWCVPEAEGRMRTKPVVVADPQDAAARLQRELQAGDIVLIKGSRAMRMEQVVALLGRT